MKGVVRGLGNPSAGERPAGAGGRGAVPRGSLAGPIKRMLAG